MRTMKILWHVVNDEEEEKNETQMREFLTESDLKLETDEFTKLTTSLKEKSLWIPEGARELQGWKVGLLERFTDDDLKQPITGIPIR